MLEKSATMQFVPSLEDFIRLNTGLEVAIHADNEPSICVHCDVAILVSLFCHLFVDAIRVIWHPFNEDGVVSSRFIHFIIQLARLVKAKDIGNE